MTHTKHPGEDDFLSAGMGVGPGVGAGESCFGVAGKAGVVSAGWAARDS